MGGGTSGRSLGTGGTVALEAGLVLTWRLSPTFPVFPSVRDHHTGGPQGNRGPWGDRPDAGRDMCGSRVPGEPQPPEHLGGTQLEGSCLGLDQMVQPTHLWVPTTPVPRDKQAPGTPSSVPPPQGHASTLPEAQSQRRTADSSRSPLAPQKPQTSAWHPGER